MARIAQDLGTGAGGAGAPPVPGGVQRPRGSSGGKSAEWHFVCEFSDRLGRAVRRECGVQHPSGGDRGPAAAGVPCGEVEVTDINDNPPVFPESEKE